MPNLWIQESYINETENYRFGDSEWFETDFGTVGNLYRFLKSKYGNGSNMYADKSDGSTRKIGWVFTGRTKYEDSDETYIRAVWVWVSTTQPSIEKILRNRTDPWAE